MGDKIIRAVTCDGAVKISAITAKDMVSEATRIHRLSQTASAALGRTLIAASIMGNDLKGEENSITIRINGDGPIGVIVAVSDYMGNTRGYCQRPQTMLPIRADGKIDVSGAVGKSGDVSVVKDLGMGKPYIGRTPLASGEIAEDITAYLAASEQVPSICALGVRVDRNSVVRCAGGYIVSLLPGVRDDEIERLEACMKHARAVTECLDEGMTPEEIMRETLSGFEIEVLDEYEVGYSCPCSRERTRGVLLTLGEAELRDMCEKDGGAEVTCQFCNKSYSFDKTELEGLIRDAAK